MSNNPPPRDLSTIPPEFRLVISQIVNSVYGNWFESDRATQIKASETLETTDATVTTLDIIPLDDETTYHIESNIIGVQSGGSNRASYQLTGTFYRSGGNATQQGSTTVIHSAESASWDAVFDVSDNDVRIRVTGIAATNILWQANSYIRGLSN